jgi:hypothetical protein
MPIFAYIICGAFLFIVVYYLFTTSLRAAKREGSLEKMLEEERGKNDIQKEYGKISSRPVSSAQLLLRRMRDQDNNK